MKRCYIHQAVSISSQGFWEGFTLPDIVENLQVFKALEPDYKSLIPAMALRRMSKITKMALMCGLSVSRDSNVDWDGIIVGTGLGNLADTEKFLLLISDPASGLIAPTAFTQSSHNTLSGQIAIQLKIHGYNMTHVQRFFSFENALKDACLQMNFGQKNVLLGAADEHIPLLNTLGEKVNFTEKEIAGFGEGACFFQLSSEPSGIYVADILIKSRSEIPSQEVNAFLQKNNIDEDSLLLVTTNEIPNWARGPHVSIAGLVGRFMSNSALAMHLGCSYLWRKEYFHVLIMNTDAGGGLGLILLSHE